MQYIYIREISIFDEFIEVIINYDKSSDDQFKVLSYETNIDIVKKNIPFYEIEISKSIKVKLPDRDLIRQALGLCLTTKPLHKSLSREEWNLDTIFIFFDENDDISFIQTATGEMVYDFLNHMTFSTDSTYILSDSLETLLLQKEIL